MLYEMPRLESADLHVLERIDELREQLRHAVRQVPAK